MADAEKRRNVSVTPSLRQYALACIDEDNGKFGVRGASCHISRVLLLARSIRDDKFALVGSKKTVRDVDGDPLLALSLKAVHQQREIDLISCRAMLLRVFLERAQLVFEQELGVIEQTSDQR